MSSGRDTCCSSIEPLCFANPPWGGVNGRRRRLHCRSGRGGWDELGAPKRVTCSLQSESDRSGAAQRGNIQAYQIVDGSFLGSGHPNPFSVGL